MFVSALRRSTRRLRSLHFVPGGVQKFLDKALASNADALIIDLEDAVSPADKPAARQEVQKWMTSVDFSSKTCVVRMNALDTTHWKEDLNAVIHKGKPDIIMVPKVSKRQDLIDISTHLDELEKSVGREVGSTTLLPIITEVPFAVFNVRDIAAGPRVEAVTWGAEDLAAELGAKKNKNKDGQYLHVFALCRSMTLLAAKAANVQAIDGVFTNFKDPEGLKTESTEAADSGWDGKMTIHPDQIDIINAAFTPTAEEVNNASALLEAAKGKAGAFQFKGKMIDAPHLKQAQKIVALGALQPTEAATGPQQGSAPEKSGGAVPGAPGAVTPTNRHGRWFEELPVGTVIYHALTRTVTETDNMLFTTLSLNMAQLHLDYEVGKTTEFGKPLVNSMFTIALLVGMTVLETTHGTTIANLGFEEVLFPKPVFYGDTIRAETEVVKAKESKSRPTQGIVCFEHRAYNQKNELVAKARRNALMKKNPANLSKL